MVLFRPSRRQCLAALVVLLPSLTFAQKVDERSIDQLVEETIREWQVPGAAVAITRGDDIIYLKGFGVREKGRPERVTPDTRFAIASATKAFTSTAVAMLVDEGKMSWDDKVRKHLPYFHLSDPFADENVTLRDILSHRTGLSRHDMLWYGSPWSREEVIRRIGKVKLSQPFRSGYLYQNIMYIAAGEAVAAAAGMPWEDFIRKRIFEPLGMTNSDCSVKDVLNSLDHASPHRKLLDRSVRVIPWRNVDNAGPAGSINSSARDLTKWMRFQLNEGTFDGKQLVSAASLHETHLPHTVVRMDQPLRMLTSEMTQLTYGLGWFINDYRGHAVVSHSGAIDGFRANITLLPKEKIGIAVLTNLDQLNVPEALRDSLVDLLLGLPRKDWNKAYMAQAAKDEAEQRAKEEQVGTQEDSAKPPRDLTEYCGIYEDPAYGTVQISAEGQRLVFAWSNFKAALRHRYFDTFFTADDEFGITPAVFHTNEAGEVDSLRMLDVEFRKVKPQIASSSPEAAAHAATRGEVSP
jgi:Beta-lactamase class C and other penicillin binding proteins